MPVRHLAYFKGGRCGVQRMTRPAARPLHLVTCAPCLRAELEHLADVSQWRTGDSDRMRALRSRLRELES